MNTRLLWHQFRKETREHLWFIIGYGIIVAICALLGATSMLENAVDSWDRPLLIDNAALYLFITLLPALFFVPFVAFADPTDTMDAFWHTKPTGALVVAGGKLLWIVVWLIGMPLIGEGVTVVALGGAGKLVYVAIDYIFLRAAILFSAFALATVAPHPLRFVFAVLAVPILLEFFRAITEAFTGVSLSEELPYAASIALSWVEIGIIAIGAIVVTLAQYRWRRPLSIGLPAMLVVIIAALFTGQRKADLTNPPNIPPDNPFAAVSLRLESLKIQHAELRPNGRDTSVLTATAVFENMPQSRTMGIVEVNLTVSANGNIHQIRQFTGDPNRLDDELQDRRRVFHEIVNQTTNAPSLTTSVLRGKIRVPLPPKVAEALTGATDYEVSGRVRVDCFAYDEFGVLHPPPCDGPTLPPNNRRATSTLRRDDVLLTMSWPVAPGNQRQVSIQYRHIASTLDPANAEIWHRGHQHVIPWFYVPRETKSGTAWGDYTGQYIESNFFTPRSALHVNRGWFSMPSSFPADEVVVYQARHVGQITLNITTTDATR